MKSLLEKASLSFASGGINDAEIYAYAAGMELIRDSLEQAEGILSEDAGIERLAELFALDSSRYGRERLRELIRRRASYEPSMLTAEDFDEEFSLTNAEDITVSGDTVVIEGIDADRLFELSVFLKGFSPLGRRAIADGEGMTFDLWEATGFNFSQYDRLCLPFDILDTLRSDTFEQH